MNQRLPALLFAALACAWAEPAQSQSPSVRAYLSPGTKLSLGRPFVLNVEISGIQSLEREPTLPDLGSFAQYLGSNRQSSMQVINGRTSISMTLQYRFQAIAEGSHRIPSFEVYAAGAAFDTEPIELTVSADAAAGGGGDGIAPEDLFVTAQASAASVFEGEPLVVEYRIWTRLDVANYSLTRLPEPEGFWVDDVTPAGPASVEERVRDGVRYATALIRRVVLVPSASGTRTVEPIGVEAQVRMRGARDPFADFFGRNSLFGTTMVPQSVLSNSLSVEVRPLPEPRPESYTGVVGDLTVSARADRDSLDANEAVTLTVDVSGIGNLRVVPAPIPDFPPDFEVFPPEVSESTRATADGLAGTKSFEYVVIPRAPGRREIPSVELSYLDPEAGAYRTVRTDVLPLTVSGSAIEGPAAIARGGVSQLREDIRFIHLGTVGLGPRTEPLQRTALFWLFLLVPLAAVAGAGALRRHQDLLTGDVAYARGRRAGRVAKQRLAEARHRGRDGDMRAFHAELAKAIRGLVADRMNLPEAGLQIAQVDRTLQERRVSDNLREELRTFLEHCDRERFAPAESRTDVEALLDRAARLMTALDGALR